MYRNDYRNDTGQDQGHSKYCTERRANGIAYHRDRQCFGRTVQGLG